MSSTTSPPEHRPTPDEIAEIVRGAGAGRRSATDVARLSDLGRQDGRQVWQLWLDLPVEARRYLARAMVELAETNVDLNFSRILRHAVDDGDAEVRAVAIAGLWEDESSAFLERLLTTLPTEPEAAVREAVAEALGRFSYRAALGDLPEGEGERVRSTLLALAQSEEPIGVRRRALESVAYFEDGEVDELIEEAYDSIHHGLRVSALIAMGRNLSERWYDFVLENLDEEDPELRFEAARAAGEYGDQRAVDQLLSLVGDADREVQFAAVGALGQIGGRLAIQALRRVAAHDDEALAEVAQDALAQAAVDSAPRLDAR